jgi:phthiocerol/phenolphthiocerol synthesis type-I polyketide synthase D
MREEERRITEWLVVRVARAAECDPAEIDPGALFDELGMSSREALLLAADFEDFLGRTVPPTLVWECPSIRAVAAHFAAGASAS